MGNCLASGSDDEKKNLIQHAPGPNTLAYTLEHSTDPQFHHYQERFQGVQHYDLDGTLYKEKYEVKRLLGAGAFARVYEVVRKSDNAPFAAKIMSRSLLDDDSAEVAVLEVLQGQPAMVQFVEVFFQQKEIIIILEHLKGGMLFDHIAQKGHYGEREAGDLMFALLELLAHCHAHGIVHRDLKPENLLLANAADEHSLRVIDWGSATLIPSTGKLDTVIGTPYYVAPEVLSKCYDEKVDVWSAGVIMYILLSGHPPFSGRTDELILARVKQGKYSFEGEEWAEVSKEAKDIIAKMLTMDSKKRPTASQLLKHAWFRVSKLKPPASLGSRLVHRLQQFQRMSKLRRLALVVLARNMADLDVQRLRDQLAAHTSHDNVVDLEGLQRALGGLGVHMPLEELRRLIETIDEGHTGEVDMDEFVAATLVSNRVLRGWARGVEGESSSQQAEQLVAQSFELLDHDHDGVISPEDLMFVLPEGTAMEEAQQMLQEVDAAGRVTIGEFKELMTKNAMMQLMSMHSMLTGLKTRNVPQAPGKVAPSNASIPEDGPEAAAPGSASPARDRLVRKHTADLARASASLAALIQHPRFAGPSQSGLTAGNGGVGSQAQLALLQRSSTSAVTLAALNRGSMPNSGDPASHGNLAERASSVTGTGAGPTAAPDGSVQQPGEAGSPVVSASRRTPTDAAAAINGFASSPVNAGFAAASKPVLIPKASTASAVGVGLAGGAGLASGSPPSRAPLSIKRASPRYVQQLSGSLGSSAERGGLAAEVRSTPMNVVAMVSETGSGGKGTAVEVVMSTTGIGRMKMATIDEADGSMHDGQNHHPRVTAPEHGYL